MYWIYMQACVPIESQNTEGTITEAFCCSGAEQYCALWHLGLDPQTVVWDYTLLVPLESQIFMKWKTPTAKLPTTESLEEPSTWLHLWGLNKCNCGIFKIEPGLGHILWGAVNNLHFH